MTLLSTYDLGPLTLPNRVIMAPMTRNRAAGDSGTVPTDMMATYYTQRASAGLIVTEATQVTPRGQGYPNTPGIHSEEQIAAWRRITDAVHESDGRIFNQLWHVGRISHGSYHDGAKPVAPSAIAADGDAMTASFEMEPFPTPHALSTDEVREVVQQYRHGAASAREAGFDGVEIHAANGYLIDQFIQSGTNKRTDRYGGALDDRLRFLREVVEAVLQEWEADRVGVRLSPGGSFNDMHDDDPIQTFGRAGEVLSEYGLTYLHTVENEFATGETASSLMRQAYDGTHIVCGGYDRASGEEALQEERADLVAYAKLFLSNPDLPERFAQNAPLNEWDQSTFYGGDAEGYIDYPTLEEAEEQEAAA